MIVYSLFADLQTKGVHLSIADRSALRVQAPAGALDEPTRALMLENKDDLLQFVYEIEEHKARVLETYDEGVEIPAEEISRAEQLAHEAVRGAQASPDGLLYLRAYAMNHPTVQAYFAAFGELAGEIVSVERVAA